LGLFNLGGCPYTSCWWARKVLFTRFASAVSPQREGNFQNNFQT
jgi:hypothetical protein